MYSFSYIMCFFMFYAVVGWCTEVIYKTTCTGKFVNRGFLNGPLCPIYGVGATIVIICLTPIQENLLVLYLGSVLLTSALEFVTGFVLEKIFHQKWWDYTEDHFNIMGYVCLKFSLLWGLGCVFIMKIIQPIVLAVIEKTPKTVQTGIFIAFYGLMAADFIITVAELAKIKKQLQIANDLDHMLNKIAEAIGSKLSSGTVKGMSEYQEQKEKIETRYAAISAKAKEKYGEHFDGTEKITFIHRRLEKAYPNLDFTRIKHTNMSEKLNGLKEKFDEFTESIGNVKL